MFTSSTPGATPAMPSRLIGAATVPATCVPCPSSSTSAGSLQEPSGSVSQAPSTSGSSVVKLRLSERLKLGAMSGCEPSIPVSRSPRARRCCRLAPVRLGRRGADCLHVPLQVGERLLERGRPVSATANASLARGARPQAAHALDRELIRGTGGGSLADGAIAGGALHGLRAGHVGHEVRVRRTDGGHPHGAVQRHNAPSSAPDSLLGGVGGGAALDQHHVGLLLRIAARRSRGERNDQRQGAQSHQKRRLTHYPSSFEYTGVAYPDHAKATPRAASRPAEFRARRRVRPRLRRRPTCAAIRRAVPPVRRGGPAAGGPSRSCPRAPARACPWPARSRSRPLGG